MVIRDPNLRHALTSEQLARVEAYYAHEAEQAKTENINMRLTPGFKAAIKRAAQANGFSKYQKWLDKVIAQAVADTFPERYADPGDDF